MWFIVNLYLFWDVIFICVFKIFKKRYLLINNYVKINILYVDFFFVIIDFVGSFIDI